MGIFNKFFSSNIGNNVTQNFSFDMRNRIETIYPYFKQVLVPSTISQELPIDFSEIEENKTYKSEDLSFITKNICGDLVCFYVLDNQNGYEYIQENHLKSVNINAEQLHEIAMSNYQRLISKQMRNQNNDDAIWFFVDGNLEACLILVDEIWDQVYIFLKEDVVVCVPARDIIFATGASKTNVISDFSEKAREILNSGDHPLSKNWFIRKNNRWEIFKQIEA